MLTALMTIFAAVAAGSTQQLPPYAESIRCAGLAEGAAGLMSAKADDARLFDAAIFWGMAASEAARKAKLSGAQFTSDQRKAAESAGEQLQRKDEGATAELEACLKRVPPLKG